MRKMFVTLGLLFFVLFIGCATNKPVFDPKMPANSVYIDLDNSWSNQCSTDVFPYYGKCSSPWRTVTIRVVNSKSEDANVTVRCLHMNTDTLFGTQTKVVENRNYTTFLVRGLARSVPDSDMVRCKISEVR